MASSSRKTSLLSSSSSLSTSGNKGLFAGREKLSLFLSDFPDLPPACHDETLKNCDYNLGAVQDLFPLSKKAQRRAKKRLAKGKESPAKTSHNPGGILLNISSEFFIQLNDKFGDNDSDPSNSNCLAFISKSFESKESFQFVLDDSVASAIYANILQHVQRLVKCQPVSDDLL